MHTKYVSNAWGSQGHKRILKKKDQGDSLLVAEVSSVFMTIISIDILFGKSQNWPEIALHGPCDVQNGKWRFIGILARYAQGHTQRQISKTYFV